MSMNDFQVICRIGEGTHSTVYKVKRIKDDCFYALKKVKLQNLSIKEIQSTVNEVRFLASVRHPNIIAYKEAFYDSHSKSLCIIMQYADGGDLLQKISEYKRQGKRFSEEYVWDIFIQILKGLNALHQLKITHRDVKSANIFLTNSGLAKLGDLDVSVVLTKGMMCQTQTGTPYYASPEIWKDQPYNSMSDVWSLGCVLYEFLHLKPPFRAREMDGLYKKVNRGYFGKIDRIYSQGFASVLQMLLCVDPFQRMTCKDLLQHPIIKQHMKKGKQIESLQSSSLLKTIRLVKNMNYLTERLPKPNYTPVRYRTFKNVQRDLQNSSKLMGGSLQLIPKMSKSLERSNIMSNVSFGKIQKRNDKFDQLRNGRYNQLINPQLLPHISDKRAKRHAL